MDVNLAGMSEMIFGNIAAIEDEENWHGKPLGAKSEASVNAIMENIVNKGKHNLCPKSPEKEVPAMAFGGVKLPEPPNYKLGDLVNCLLTKLLCIY